MQRLLRWIAPYGALFIVGIALGWGMSSVIAGRRLAEEQAARARDHEQHAEQMKAISDAALAAQQKATAMREVQARRIETLDAQLSQERQVHENENQRLRDALAAGTERLRVAVVNCSTRSRDMSGFAATTGMGDGSPTYAELDPTVAERVFRVADDDQREIDKLKALQAYVCTVRPETAECSVNGFQSAGP